MIVVLDLKDNQLIEVPGLDALPGLKLLNLADNPKLRLQSVLRQLQVTAALEQVMFAVATAPQIASASAAAAVATSAAPIATAGSSKRVAKSTLRVPPSAGRGAAVPSDEVATAAPPVLLAHAPAATAHKRAKGTPKYQASFYIHIYIMLLFLSYLFVCILHKIMLINCFLVVCALIVAASGESAVSPRELALSGRRVDSGRAARRRVPRARRQRRRSRTLPLAPGAQRLVHTGLQSPAPPEALCDWRAVRPECDYGAAAHGRVWLALGRG